jgi:hypothetical protein
MEEEDAVGTAHMIVLPGDHIAAESGFLRCVAAREGVTTTAGSAQHRRRGSCPRLPSRPSRCVPLPHNPK